MAKINQYPAKTVPSNNDEFVLHDPSSGSTKKMTRGDLIGGAPLPANTVDGQAIADGSVTPAKRSGGFKVGIIEGTVLGSTGNKTITGVGFKPKLVRFTLMPTYSSAAANFATGAMTPTGQFASTMASSGTNSARSSSSTASFLYVSSSGTTILRFEYVSMNNDGFTINVVDANSDFRVSYEAYA